MCFRQTLMMSSLWISSLLQLLPRNGVDGDQHMTRLFHQLLIDYNKEIRPVIQHNRPVNTSIAFSLVQVVDVDERNQLLTSLAWIHFRWNDWRLAWDPQLNGRLTKLNVPVESIWIPDIILYNNAAQEYLKEMTTASVTYDGNISLSMAGIFKSSCALDVRFYPFDFQSCLMKFASWAYDGTKIDIWSESKGDQSNYMVSTEWTLRDVRAEKNSVIYSCCPEPYPFIDVHLLLERKPLFFVIFLCLPCVLISLLVLLGFYMPSDSGEKVTLGITSLLSTTVFLMLVSEHLPPTADALPLIGIYYGVTIFIVSLQTAFTVFTLNIHHIGTHGRPVPPLLQHLLFGRFSNLLLLNLEHRYHSINEHVQYFFVKQVNEEKAELERQKRRKNGNGSDDEEEEEEEGKGGEQRENGGEGGGKGREEEDAASTDEQPVWQLAADMAAAAASKRRRLVVGNGAPRPFQQHQSNNKGAATAETELLDGSASKKRVSFPELPPESPIPGGAAAAVFLYQNGGPPCIGKGKRRRILSLVPSSSSSTTCFSPPKLAKGRRMASMRMARLNHQSADLLQPQGPGRPSAPMDASREESPSKESSTTPDAPQQEKEEEEGGLCFEGEFIRVLSRLQEVIERNELRLVEKDRRNAEKLEWQQVALVLDRFLLVIFTAITIAVLLCTVFNSERSALW